MQLKKVNFVRPSIASLSNWEKLLIVFSNSPSIRNPEDAVAWVNGPMTTASSHSLYSVSKSRVIIEMDRETET